jgi:hypothetical protein
MGNADEDALKALQDGFDCRNESHKQIYYKIVRDYMFDKLSEIKLLKIKLKNDEESFKNKEESYNDYIESLEKQVEMVFSLLNKK